MKTQETQVQSWVREDPLEMEMETHSSILAWKIRWTEDTGVLQSMRSQRVRHDLSDWAHTQLICYPEAMIFKHLRWEDQGELHCQLKSMNTPPLLCSSTLEVSAPWGQIQPLLSDVRILSIMTSFEFLSEGKSQMDSLFFFNDFTLSLCFWLCHMGC